MRDFLLTSESYFSEFAKEKEKQIFESQDRILNNVIPTERIPVVRHRVFVKSLEKLIAKFSKGDELDAIKIEFKSVLEYMVEGWDDLAVKLKKGNPPIACNKYMLNEYCYMVWMLSLAVLLDVSEHEINALKSIIKKGEIDDELIVLLLSFLTKEKVNNVSKTTYKPFSGLIKSGQLIDSKSMKNYLDKWYQNTKLLVWHNYKSSIKSTKYYYGYWSFESAAVVKIMGLDDSSFRDHQYYPKDLVS